MAGAFRLEPDESLGQRAERNVHERLRAALPPEYQMLANVAWLVRDRGVEREGEADLVIAHPEHGFLAIEVKAGPIRRDSLGRWWAGSGQLDRSPFQQAADSHHSLVAKLRELPDWEAGLDPIAGHAVAFPNVEVASLGAKILMGTDADPELILDKALLEPDAQRNRKLREWVDRCFELWDRGAKRGPGAKGIELLTSMMTSPIELRSLLRSEIADGNREVVRLTDEQLYTLNTLRGVRRAGIVGGAGTGKTMLAIAKAKQLASEGFETLLVCFNSAARAGARGRDARGRGADGRAAARQDVPPAGRGPRARGRHAARQAGAGDRRVVRGDAAGGAG